VFDNGFRLWRSMSDYLLMFPSSLFNAFPFLLSKAELIGERGKGDGDGEEDGD
jgi:hypothetical protein